eukprot:2488315-Amphidinium_carterae.1
MMNTYQAVAMTTTSLFLECSSKRITHEATHSQTCQLLPRLRQGGTLDTVSTPRQPVCNQGEPRTNGAWSWQSEDEMPVPDFSHKSTFGDSPHSLCT